jgi:hypothetical protein
MEGVDCSISVPLVLLQRLPQVPQKLLKVSVEPWQERMTLIGLLVKGSMKLSLLTCVRGEG